jgi:hypothetical protein
MRGLPQASERKPPHWDTHRYLVASTHIGHTSNICPNRVDKRSSMSSRARSLRSLATHARISSTLIGHPRTHTTLDTQGHTQHWTPTKRLTFDPPIDRIFGNEFMGVQSCLCSSSTRKYVDWRRYALCSVAHRCPAARRTKCADMSLTFTERNFESRSVHSC